MPFAKSHALFAALLSVGLALGACSTNPLGPEGEAALRNTPAAGPGSPGEFATAIGDRVFFESDSSELTPTAIATLDRQADWLARWPRWQITMEGHADERGTREYNFALGARRGEAARDYLVSKGVPAARIRSISYGKERPVAVCNDISCWSQNRRAATVLGAGAGS